MGDWSNVWVLSPPCFLEMGRAAVWNAGDVLEMVSRRVVVRVSRSALEVEAKVFLTAKVGLGGGESVDLRLRLSREEWLIRIPAIPGVSSMRSVILSDKTGRAMDDAKLPLRCRCCFSFRSGVGEVVEKTGMWFWVSSSSSEEIDTRGTPRDLSGGGVGCDFFGRLSLSSELDRSSFSFRRHRGLSDLGIGEMLLTYEDLLSGNIRLNSWLTHPPLVASSLTLKLAFHRLPFRDLIRKPLFKLFDELG